MADSFQETHQRYQSALDQAFHYLKSLIHSHHSKNWLLVPPTSIQINQSRSQFNRSQPINSHHFLNGFAPFDFSNVQVHRRKLDGSSVVRAVSDVSIDPSRFDIDDLKAVLQTAQVRGSWDNLVDKSTVIEVLDPQTRIVKTDFRLGWPANPRDAITISKTFIDSSSVIDISTSLPRSSDEPAYLRPSPPFVRSHVHLLAWCIQLIPESPISHPSHSPQLDHIDQSTELGDSPEQATFTKPHLRKARITVFWNVNWKGAIFSSHHSQIASLLNGFVDYVRNQASEIPILASYGNGIDLGSSSYNKSDEKFSISYAILPEDSSTDHAQFSSDSFEKGGHPSESTRLERFIELKLPVDQGWDVQVSVQGYGEDVDEKWDVTAEKPSDAFRTVLRIKHAKLPKSDQLVRVNVIVQRLAGGKITRVNQTPIKVVTVESNDNNALSNIFRGDAQSISELSIQTASGEKAKLTSDTASTLDTNVHDPCSPCPQVTSQPPTRLNPSRVTVISTLLRRSYIYFSSLLQEPEAKWRHVSDSRGVSVTQLQSIDPTLTVYRAEATFVGVGVWNVLSAIATVGARLCWDKNLTELKLLEELNDLSSLWQTKQKGTWPIAPRDSILITTTYKSPTSVHIFSVSSDDSNLFPSIQPPPPGYIRTRTEILGWSIESLSPTTTQITLIDQHDPLGWSPKTWTPSQLIAQVAGVGEYALKSGGPPMITRIAGARVTLSKYEHEKGTFRAEYTASESPLTPAIMDISNSPACLLENSDVSSVELELRCDCESWASSLDIVVDPPPAKASCLKRHKLSSGGGFWITIEHDTGLLAQDKIKILVRRGKSRADDRGSVILNGTGLKVDVEELTAEETKSLATQRRVKTSLIPLDQYPLVGPRTWKSSPSASNSATRSSTPTPERNQEEGVGPVPDVASLKPTVSLLQSSGPSPLSAPMASALEALAHLQTFHIEQGPDIMVPPVGWTLVAEKGCTSVYKKIVPQISETFPVYRADRVIQGVAAEEMAATLATVSSRSFWDDRIESACLLESYGNGCTTHLLTTKPTFPFKARLLQTANVHALVQFPSSSISSSSSTVHFLASASFKRSSNGLLTNSKLNPQGLIEAHMFLEGWIMETVDPYSSSSHEIPSTRCTYFSSIDYGGTLPVALNSMSNSSLHRMIRGLEVLVRSHGPVPRICQPAFGFRMNGSLRIDDLNDWKWKLDGADNSRVTLSVDATPKSPFRAMFLLQKGANEATAKIYPTGSSGPPPCAHPNSRYETVRALGVTTATTNDSEGGANLVRRLVSNPDLHTKPNTGHLRRIGTSWASNLHGAHVKDAKLNELVIAELVLDRKFYPQGCRVLWKASFLKSGTNPVIEKDVHFPLPPEADTVMIPLKVAVHQMPSPAIFAAALDPTARREHMLLRMTIPMRDISLKDPSITNTSDSELSPPSLWYSRLSKRSVVLHVSIEQIGINQDDLLGSDLIHESSKSIKQNSEFQMIVNGEKQNMILMKDSPAEFDRREVDDCIGLYPSLSRVGRTSLPKQRQASNPQIDLATAKVDNVLPGELELPLAISLDLRNDLQDDTGSSSLPDSVAETPHLLSPVNEDKELEDENLGKNHINGSANPDVDSNNRNSNGRFEYIKNLIFNSSHKLNQTNNFFQQIRLKSKRTYTNRHMILIGLISFLLGSILRSMLIPSDYLIIPPSPPPSRLCSSTSLSSKVTAIIDKNGDIDIDPTAGSNGNEDCRSSNNAQNNKKMNEDGSGSTRPNCHYDRHDNDHSRNEEVEEGYFRLSESDKQLLKLLETRNHWKEIKKVFEFKLFSYFSYFFHSSWSLLIAFVKH